MGPYRTGRAAREQWYRSRVTEFPAIAIRTIAFHEGRFAFQAGAGIVADSEPEREHAEVLSKSRALSRALELAEEPL